MVTLEKIRESLAAHRPEVVSVAQRQHAAVAAVLHEADEGMEVLFIERAKRDSDPWSGHLAFPGGRVDDTDPNPRSAAERETLEEIGLDLAQTEYLGRLDDLCGRPEASLVISGFAFHVPEKTGLELNYEVEDAFWIPLNWILDTERHVTYPFVYKGRDIAMPAIDLLGTDRPVLWGLTYRFLEILLTLAGRSIPSLPWK